MDPCLARAALQKEERQEEQERQNGRRRHPEAFVLMFFSGSVFLRFLRIYHSHKYDFVIKGT